MLRSCDDNKKKMLCLTNLSYLREKDKRELTMMRAQKMKKKRNDYEKNEEN